MSRRAFMNPRSYSGAALSIAAGQRLKEQYERTGPVFRSIPPAERVRAGDDLSTLQKLALLQMMNSTLARGVAKKLASNEGIQAKPSIVDYHILRERGVAEKLDGMQFHELTFEGSKLAAELLARLCADLDVHILQPDKTIGAGPDIRTYYKCSCGGWGRSFQGNGQFAWRRASNAFHEHWNPMARGVDG